MRFLTFLGRYFSSILLNLVVLLFVFSVSFLLVIGNKQTIKDTLVESNAYNELVPALSKSISSSNSGLSDKQQSNGNGSNDENSIPFDDPGVQAVINKDLPPSFLQSQTEGLLDSVFAWLDGTQEELKFKIDLTEAKDNFIVNLSEYAVNRVDGLPDCKVTDLGVDKINVFDLDCKPIGFSAQEVSSQMANDLSTGDFLNDTVITQDDIKNKEGQTISEQFAIAPAIYSISQKSLLISIGALLLIAAFYISVRLPFLRGLQSFGRRLIADSLIPLLFTIAFRILLPNITKSANSGMDNISDLATKIGGSFATKVDTAVIIGFSILAAAGFMILIVDYFIRRSEKHKLKTHNHTRDNPTDDGQKRIPTKQSEMKESKD